MIVPVNTIFHSKTRVLAFTDVGPDKVRANGTKLASPCKNMYKIIYHQL